MPCPKGGEHSYQVGEIDGQTRFVCIKCNRVSGFAPVKSYADLLKECEELKAFITELEEEIKLLKNLLWESAHSQ